jgi:glycosyltransferase involved in cell wall biosynthesis
LEHTGNCAKVRNAALKRASGEYVAFLDSDDVWENDKLELQIKSTQRWSYTGYRLIDGSGTPITLPNVSKWVPYEGAISRQILSDQAHVSTPSVMVARSLLEEAGYFDEQLRLFEDYDLWLRLLDKSDVAVIDKPLVNIRRHGQHTCGTGVVMLVAREKALRKLHRLIKDRGVKRTIRRIRTVNAWQRLKWWLRVPAV